MTKRSRRTQKPPPRAQALPIPDASVALEGPLDDAPPDARATLTITMAEPCHTPGCVCLTGAFFLSVVSLHRSAVRIVPCADLRIEHMMGRAGRTTHRTDDLIARLTTIARRGASDENVSEA